MSYGLNASTTSAGTVFPETDFPMNPATPVPNIVSTSPVTTWFPRSVTVMNA